MRRWHEKQFVKAAPKVFFLGAPEKKINGPKKVIRILFKSVCTASLLFLVHPPPTSIYKWGGKSSQPSRTECVCTTVIHLVWNIFGRWKFLKCRTEQFSFQLELNTRFAQDLSPSSSTNSSFSPSPLPLSWVAWYQFLKALYWVVVQFRARNSSSVTGTFRFDGIAGRRSSSHADQEQWHTNGRWYNSIYVKICREDLI